jgi:leucyl-tRNA synthetase
MKKYDHKKIEGKQQKAWAKTKLYTTKEDTKKPKYYVLDMFPYPSGEGLHVGHPKGYIATDVVSRMKRMQGFSVLHPMGFDAFGLPAENYAIKMKVNPAVAVAKNVARYKKQLEILGFDYDWNREVNTTDPAFYKWTQWAFLKMYEKGLAYESSEPINWCPSCKTGLANEDLEDGKCERCGSVVEKKPIRQWVIRITKYADRLLADLDALDWPESIKESQRNWIGRSEGAELVFPVVNASTKHELSNITVFTTRPDTLYGVTYAVVAPEHALLTKLKTENPAAVSNWAEIESYTASAKAKSEIDRTDVKREKTGVMVHGVSVKNPITGELVSLFVADYVLADYGTGAVMAVPAHDERDFAFAKRYGLPIKEVILGGDIKTGAFAGFGTLVHSGHFSGQNAEVAQKGIVSEAKGKWVVKFKLKDWVFSRQRYWGEPFPIMRDGDVVVPVSEKDLPVILPKVKSYEPSGTGESPLATIKKWVEVKIGKEKSAKKMMRETNTMPQWAGSSWYYLRYMDPRNSSKLVDPKKEHYWNEVDLYVGGAEHATRHLIYARFWHKFLFDMGVVSTKEPFKKLQSVGLIMAEDGRKMSKRYGNVVNPDDIVATYGADTMRVYEMFMGPFDQAIAWNTQSMIGSRRFIERVWRLGEKVSTTKKHVDTPVIEAVLNKTIKKVTEDISMMRFNTAISTLMATMNEFEKNDMLSRGAYEKYLKLVAPFAPHVADELYAQLGNKKSIHITSWPICDETKIGVEKVKIAVQVMGKVRGVIEVEKDLSEAVARELALALPEVKKWVDGKEIVKVIYVPGRIVNIVVKG